MTYKPVNRTNKSRQKILADERARAIYEATKVQIDLAMKLKKARINRKMTQEDVAVIMHTHKPAISRLEAGGDDIKNFPSLLTLIKFASAIGHELKIVLTPIKNIRKTNLENYRDK